MKSWLEPNSRPRRVLFAFSIYVVVVATYFAIIPRARIVEHTPFNHFALLADCWLHGRLNLGGAPPAYGQNNDFAKVGNNWFITFPPFPAVVLLPVVRVAGSAENVRDGQIFVWLSGIGPAVLFLALEKLRRMGVSGRIEPTNIALALLFAFGTVYFFTAVQGTVWFAAHVVAVALAAMYLLFALDAQQPVLSGLMIGLGFMTRSPLLFAAPLFLFEALRTSLRSANAEPAHAEPADSTNIHIAALTRLIDGRRFVRKVAWFSLPVTIIMAIAFWHNKARFGNPMDFGYEYLTVAWQGRMKKWGLFDYHYLARNLGVVLTSLPWVDATQKPPFQINSHGLALWVTTPLFLWLVWPKRVGALAAALYLTAFAVAAPTLFYQNTGWIQFGYRFSNDYSVFLFALLAITGHRFGNLFAAAAAWSLVVNAFGAYTFDRDAYRRYYYEDRSQKILYQPD